MRRRLLPFLLVALLLVFAVSVAACGGDNDTSDSVRTDVEQQADRIRDAAKSGDTKKLRSEAEKTCVKLAEKIPVESERTKAIQDCRDSVR